MKKTIIIAALCLFGFHAFGQNELNPIGTLLEWQVRPVTPIIGGHPRPKAPVQCPTVSIDDHTLYIYDVAYAFTLYLLDEDGEVAYTTSVAAGTPTVTLPSDLTGDYELLLVPGGSYYFSGWIEL